MSNPSKSKGDRWERALVDFFRSRGHNQVARLRARGVLDEGDLTGFPLWAVEAKDDSTMSPWAMALQAEAEASNAKKPFGAAFRKSPRRPPSEATVIMTMETWLRLNTYIHQLRQEAP
jgi:hypothetical protein